MAPRAGTVVSSTAQKYNSLHLLNRYFIKYPADAEKFVPSIKGGIDLKTMKPDGSKAGVRRSVDNVLKLLDGEKSLDIFECARIDPDTPIETTITGLAEYVKEGKIKGIALSEVKVETIRRAHQVHPICGVEVELSLWFHRYSREWNSGHLRRFGGPNLGLLATWKGFSDRRDQIHR